MTTAASLAFLRSGKFQFERYATAETSARVFGDLAVATGRLERTRRMGERVLDDRWKVVSFHASEAAP